MKRFLAMLFALTLLVSATAFAASWTGQISKKEGKLVFESEGKTYSITNPQKAEGLEGKSVKLVGVADQATNAVTITTVSPSS